MRRSGRSNVEVAHASRPPPDGLAVASLRSLELKMESSCWAAESRRSFRFCPVRLAMPSERLSDRLDAQNAQIVSEIITLRRDNVPRCERRRRKNSPAFQRWANRFTIRQVPAGTTERLRRAAIPRTENHAF